jgi:hypothetical protein
MSGRSDVYPVHGRKRRDFNTKREDQYVKAYRTQFRKADHAYYHGVHTSNSKVDGLPMGPFEAKYESMKKSLLVFTEMGSINAGLAEFINYIAEHGIAGRWGVQGAWCSRHVNESVCESLLFSFEICWDYIVRTRMSIIRRPILMITQRITSMILTTLVILIPLSR